MAVGAILDKERRELAEEKETLVRDMKKEFELFKRKKDKEVTLQIKRLAQEHQERERRLHALNEEKAKLLADLDFVSSTSEFLVLNPKKWRMKILD